MTVLERQTAEHYGGGNRAAPILAALGKAGKSIDPIAVDDLAPYDEMHTRGVEATDELITILDAMPGHRVLDVGSGLGGAARRFAARTGASITGIDLTPELVAAATDLTRRCGLANLVTFVEGSALVMPFAENEFDSGYHIHVAMNIADKAGLYAEIFRVLKPGATFIIYDPVATGAGHLTYPAPWASVAENSHILTGDALCDVVTGAGFRLEDRLDVTDRARAWYNRIDVARAVGKAPPVAPSMIEPARNHRRNIEGGLVALILARFRKP